MMLRYNSRPRNLTRSNILAVVMTSWTSSDCYTCLHCLYSKAAKIDMKMFHGDIPHFVWLVIQDRSVVLSVGAENPVTIRREMALTKGKLGRWLCALVVSEPPCSRILLHVGLEEHRWSSRAWHVSHTLTGLGEAGSGSSLSEQLLQKISPQLRQWCCGERRRHVRDVLRRRVYGSVSAESARALTFRLEMENSFSHSLQWLASLSFNQTWPPWNKEYFFCQAFFYILHDTQNDK